MELNKYDTKESDEGVIFDLSALNSSLNVSGDFLNDGQ